MVVSTPVVTTPSRVSPGQVTIDSNSPLTPFGTESIPPGMSAGSMMQLLIQMQSQHNAALKKSDNSSTNNTTPILITTPLNTMTTSPVVMSPRHYGSNSARPKVTKSGLFATTANRIPKALSQCIETIHSKGMQLGSSPQTLSTLASSPAPILIQPTVSSVASPVQSHSSVVHTLQSSPLVASQLQQSPSIPAPSQPPLVTRQIQASSVTPQLQSSSSVTPQLQSSTSVDPQIEPSSLFAGQLQSASSSIATQLQLAKNFPFSPKKTEINPLMRTNSLGQPVLLPNLSRQTLVVPSAAPLTNVAISASPRPEIRSPLKKRHKPMMLGDGLVSSPPDKIYRAVTMHGVTESVISTPLMFSSASQLVFNQSVIPNTSHALNLNQASQRTQSSNTIHTSSPSPISHTSCKSISSDTSSVTFSSMGPVVMSTPVSVPHPTNLVYATSTTMSPASQSQHSQELASVVNSILQSENCSTSNDSKKDAQTDIIQSISNGFDDIFSDINSQIDDLRRGGPTRQTMKMVVERVVTQQITNDRMGTNVRL